MRVEMLPWEVCPHRLPKPFLPQPARPRAPPQRGLARASPAARTRAQCEGVAPELLPHRLPRVMVRFFRQPSSDHTATAQSGVVCRPRRSVLLRALSCFCHTPPAARGWRVARQFSFSPQQSLTTPPGIKFRALLWSNSETVIPLCTLSTATPPLGYNP